MVRTTTVQITDIPSAHKGEIKMKMKAQVYETVSGTFKNDKEQDQPYFQLQVMDIEAPVKEIINLKVKPELLELAKSGINKIANVLVSYNAKAGKLSFHGYAAA